jgi:tRNA(His) 5'-end guanylyltransferase
MSKKKHNDLETRMKEYYEFIPKTKLMRRTPVAVRLDGRSFHTLTRGLKKPFDDILVEAMQETTKYLCENIQGCVFGYTQSDEITLILVDYKKLDSCAWFDNEVQKICSISASMATMFFNKQFEKAYLKSLGVKSTPEDILYLTALKNCVEKGAMFDSRCFNIPKEEVTNLVYWRQQDAAKNSVQMVGRAYFSHKELDGKHTGDIQDMLHEQKGINWNDYPVYLKRGTAVIYEDGKWIIDKEMPILKGDDREYLDKRIFIGE